MYTITHSMTALYCASSSDVSYDVVIVNACETASFSLGSTFSTLLGATIDYTITDPVSTIAWDYGTDVMSSILWTDPCGDVV